MFSCLFQFSEAACIPWLVGSSCIFKASSVASLNRSCWLSGTPWPLLLPSDLILWLLASSCKDPYYYMRPSGWYRIIFHLRILHLITCLKSLLPFKEHICRFWVLGWGHHWRPSFCLPSHTIWSPTDYGMDNSGPRKSGLTISGILKVEVTECVCAIVVRFHRGLQWRAPLDMKMAWRLRPGTGNTDWQPLIWNSQD